MAVEVGWCVFECSRNQETGISGNELQGGFRTIFVDLCLRCENEKEKRGNIYETSAFNDIHI